MTKVNDKINIKFLPMSLNRQRILRTAGIYMDPMQKIVYGTSINFFFAVNFVLEKSINVNETI